MFLSFEGEVKENLAAKLFCVYQQFFKASMSPQKPVFPLISEDTKRETLVGESSDGLRQRVCLCDNNRGGGGFWDLNSKFAVVCTKARYNRHFMGSYWRSTNQSSKLI